MTGDIEAGLPSFTPPIFHIPARGNSGEDQTGLSFLDLVSQLGAAIIMVPIIAILNTRGRGYSQGFL